MALGGGLFPHQYGHVVHRIGFVEALEQFRRHGFVVRGPAPDAVHQGLRRGQVGPGEPGIIDGGWLDGIDGLPGIDPHHFGPVIQGLEPASLTDGPGGLAVGSVQRGDQPITPGDEGFIGNSIAPGGPGSEQGDLDGLLAGIESNFGLNVPGEGFRPGRQREVERPCAL